MTNELVSCECASLREKLAVAEAKIEALIALLAKPNAFTEHELAAHNLERLRLPRK